MFSTENSGLEAFALRLARKHLEAGPPTVGASFLMWPINDSPFALRVRYLVGHGYR